MTQLDQLLHDALHDDRLALPVPAGTLQQVRRMRRRRQRFAIAGTAAATAVVLGGAVLTVSALSSPTSTLSPYATGGAVPGITPDWTPDSGADWLLTNQEYDDFYATHHRAPVASPGPGEGRVPSPAPLTEESADLLADVQAAAWPAGTTFTREDSPGGDRDETAVHVLLPDGTPVEIRRTQLVGPYAFHESGGDGIAAGATEVDIPGTTSAAVTYPVYGYSFGKRSLPGGVYRESHGVNVVTRGGVTTSWAVPYDVPLADVRAWAFAAAQHAGG